MYDSQTEDLLDLAASAAGRCFKRHLPKGYRFVILLVSPDGVNHTLANLPIGDEAIDSFLDDFSVRFSFPKLLDAKVIQIVT